MYTTMHTVQDGCPEEYGPGMLTMEEHGHKPPEGCRKANARCAFITLSIMLFSTLSSLHI